MPDLVFSPETEADLVRIWRDISIYSERAAENIVADIDHAISSLARFPELGMPRPELGRDLRLLVVRRYLIAYRFDQSLDEIQIVRVLEGERDLTDLF